MKSFLKRIFILEERTCTPTKIRIRAIFGMLLSIVVVAPFIAFLIWDEEGGIISVPG